MSLYERFLLPRLIDLAMQSRPVMRQREKVVPLAAGDVLEIGVGSGLNLRFYDRTRVRRLFALDPSVELGRLARRRAAEAGLTVDWLPFSEDGIPLPPSSLDCILITYTLCTIPAVEEALADMRRVLRPGGRLLFSEHSLAPEEKVRRWQRRLTPTWKRWAGGCHLDRPIPLLLAAAGFQWESPSERYLPGPRPLSYHVWGSALRTG